jgi:hypothetical protein
MRTARHSPEAIWNVALKAFSPEEIGQMSPQRQRMLLFLSAEALDEDLSPSAERIEGVKESLDDMHTPQQEELLKALSAFQTTDSETSA